MKNVYMLEQCKREGEKTTRTLMTQRAYAGVMSAIHAAILMINAVNTHQPVPPSERAPRVDFLSDQKKAFRIGDPTRDGTYYYIFPIRVLEDDDWSLWK